jgi:hypothetical protein
MATSSTLRTPSKKRKLNELTPRLETDMDGLSNETVHIKIDNQKKKTIDSYFKKNTNLKEIKSPNLNEIKQEDSDLVNTNHQSNNKLDNDHNNRQKMKLLENQLIRMLQP